MSEIDDCADYAENYMEQDDYSDNESECTDLKQLDKRAHHNALERKRRDHIKDSFSSLRDAIPLLHGEKINSHKASRAQILKKAAEYIDHMRRKNNDHQKDIDILKRENKLLEEKIRSLEELKCADQSKNSETKGNNNNNNTNNTNNSKPQVSSSTRTRSKSLVANNSSSSTNGSSNSLSTNGSLNGSLNGSTNGSTNGSMNNSNANNSINSHTTDGTSLLQSNRVKSESISSFEANSDDSENVLDNHNETVVQIMKKANVVANGKITLNGTTLLLNGTIIKQASIPQQTHSLLEPPIKRKRLIVAANTSINK